MHIHTLRRIASTVAVAGVALSVSPTSLIAGGVTLDAGALQATATLEINMSEGAVGQPLSLAPDVAYGASEALTLAVVHSTVAVTGFRGSAGRGLCLSGTGGGCAAPYDNVGVEATYALATGPLAVGALGGVHAISLDGGFYDLKLGARLRYTRGKLAATSAPALLIALTERDINPDSIWLPIAAQYKVAPPMAIGLSTGLKGRLDGFADAWEVPVGAYATYTAAPPLTIGASWVFGRLLGGAGDDVTGPEARALQLWLSYTR